MLDTTLEITTFGGLSIHRDGKPVPSLHSGSLHNLPPVAVAAFAELSSSPGGQISCEALQLIKHWSVQTRPHGKTQSPALPFRDPGHQDATLNQHALPKSGNLAPYGQASVSGYAGRDTW